jgi:protein-disulfide isomerase
MSEELATPNTSLEEGKLTKAERKKLRREEKQLLRARELRRRKTTRLLRWGAVVVGIAIIVGGLMGMVGREEGGSPPAGGGSGVAAVAESDWTKGSRQAPATLIEYGDFQCPACRAYQPVVGEIAAELGDNLLVVFRQFPLRQSHPQAQLAAQAAEAAGRQGKFWEMHDLLFERQSEWSNQPDAEERFIQYAQELGLSREQFSADLEDGALAEAIEEDVRSGLAAGVNATPTFYLNGEKMEGFSNYDEFKNRIREAARTPS